MPRRNPEPEAASADADTATQPADPLDTYRDSLQDLASSAEKLEALRQVEVSLRADADGVANAKEKLLADSVTTTDEDSAVEELNRLRSRGELFERKLADISRRVSEAEVEASRAFLRAKSDLQALWRSWCMGFVFDSALQKADGFLIPGCGQGFREQVARMSRLYADAFVLEPTAETAEGLAEQAQRLLEAVSGSGWSDVPVPQSKAPVAPLVVDPDEPPCMPRGDLGINVGEEFDRYLREDPSMTHPRAMKRLFKEHPEIFVPLASDFEFEQQNAWPAGMVGSTVPG